jgi:PAS domain S-box-containing protein
MMAPRDVTRQDDPSRREARLRAILESAVDAIVTIDATGRVESFNPAAERLFGYAAAEVIGRNVSVLMPEPYAAGHDRYLRRYLATGERRIIGIGREVVGRRKDGSTFPMHLSVGEAAAPDGRLFTGIIHDLTDRKRDEEALRASHRELERALADLRAKGDELNAMTQQLWQAAKLAAVGELAAGIAHELNNPLATVGLRVESILAQTPEGDPRRRPLEVVDQEVERMGHLVANLLSFSRRGQPRVSTLDLREELAKTLDLVRHLLRNRGVSAAEHLDPALPAVHADRQLLRQVFLNLFTNALDAMAQGGALTVRARPGRLGDSAAVTVEVADTGTGIPPEHLPRIFEPFFTTKEEGKGTGLGLAVCRRVVQEQGGVIEIESELGRGTTVRITLPVESGGGRGSHTAL